MFACKLPQRQGVVRAVGLAVPHQVAALFTEREQRLGLGAGQRAVVPSERHTQCTHTHTHMRVTHVIVNILYMPECNTLFISFQEKMNRRASQERKKCIASFTLLVS